MNKIGALLIALLVGLLGVRLLLAEKRVSYLEGQMAGVVVTVSHDDDGTGPEYHWVDNKPLHKTKTKRTL